MTWALLLTLAAIVFVNRYVFLDPNTPVKMPQVFHDALRYSAPCLLTAICGPIILMENDIVRAFPGNPYFLGINLRCGDRHLHPADGGLGTHEFAGVLRTRLCVVTEEIQGRRHGDINKGI